MMATHATEYAYIQYLQNPNCKIVITATEAQVFNEGTQVCHKGAKGYEEEVEDCLPKPVRPRLVRVIDKVIVSQVQGHIGAMWARALPTKVLT